MVSTFRTSREPVTTPENTAMLSAQIANNFGTFLALRLIFMTFVPD